MLPWLVRHVFYPLHELLRGRRTLSILKELRRVAEKTPDEVCELRDQALSRLVTHAAREVPFYRDWFRESGLNPRDIRTAADLVKLPVVDKSTLRSEGRRMVADSHVSKIFHLATGGSSGEPLIFWTDKIREASQLAAKLRAREWWGIQIGDSQVDLWGSPIELSANDHFRVLKDRLLNFRLLSAFRLSDEAMAAFKPALKQARASFVYGYASVLARYARFLEARRENLSDLRLKGAITTAEFLFPDQRQVIEHVFGCPVINEYGCRDGGFIAQECPRGTLHISLDTTHVEILSGDQPSPPGEIGEVAVTNLWSYGMPILRYKLGDRARLGDLSCSCGLPFPSLASLEGRVTDTLFLPDGNRVHGLGVMYVIRVLEGVERFQVIQEELNRVSVLLVVSATADRPNLEAEIHAGLSRVLGQEMAVHVDFVDEIPVLPSGKMRSVWNKLGETRL